MTSKRFNFAGLGVIALLVCLFMSMFACEAMAAAYQKCNVPPTIGIGSKPNLLLVMDYSGSMQFPAYFGYPTYGYYGNDVAYTYTGTSSGTGTGVLSTYEPTYSYYGTFESDKYYVYVASPAASPGTLDYFRLATTPPVTMYGITNSAQGSDDAHIVFTAAGHTFAVGDLVALYDLTSHVALNTKAVKVTAVGSDTFTVTSTTDSTNTVQTTVKWNGKADTAGSAVKRITGSLIPTTGDDYSTAPGVSGNILNYAITSRTDAALKALIGGRSICPECTYDSNGVVLDGNHDYFLRPQGARRRVQDTSYLFTDFYVRAATIVNTAAYTTNANFPNDYDSAGTYYKDSSNNDRDIFVTIRGSYSGQTVATSPRVRLGNPLSQRLFEAWTFTLTKTTKVQITLDGLDGTPGNDYLLIYSAAPTYNFDGTSPAAITSSSGNPASINTDLAAGTYYVIATYTNGGTGSSYQKSYTMTSNVNLTKYVVSGYAHNGQVLTKIGALPWGRARLKLEPNDKGEKDSRNGVIQRSWGSVRYGFMFYKGDIKDHKGKIVFGLGETNEAKLIGALEGVDRWPSDGLDYTQIYPYHGTPTGEAMYEAYDYYRQQTNSDYADNSNFIQKGKYLDPFYDGDDKPNPCRKNFVLLISDGVWNGQDETGQGVDPVKGAHQLWVNDLRTGGVFDPGKQSVETYAILAFSDEQEGYNSMKAVAMYGSFKEISGCGNAGWPYPETGYPTGANKSKDMQWPVAECDPTDPLPSGHSYDTKCCKEWDSIWDDDGDGILEGKGIPDNYFEASDGKKLEDALLKVIGAITSPLSAASAVATVSQETRSDSDVIVRGVFEAIDQSDNDKFLWLGHLEAYFPFTYNNETVYDFQDDIVPNDFSNPKTIRGLCYRLPATGLFGQHCWDAAKYMKDQSPVTFDARNIFTAQFTGRDVSSLRPIWVPQPITTTNTNLHPVDFGVSTEDEKNNIIQWVRGDYITGYRNRNGWILGDIVYSTPVVVGPPRLGNVSKRDPNVRSFMDYLEDLTARPKVVYVGANDGMLHAYLMSTTPDDGQTWALQRNATPPAISDSNIGKELWAYMPSNLLTELKALKDTNYGALTGTGACSHRYMVDLAARHWEVYIKSDHCGTRPDGTARADGQGRCWRSVIVGGERGGGDAYFAIDITDPYSPILLWEYSVLQNRVVVESETDNCMQSCRNTCAANYTTCYSNCCLTHKKGNGKCDDTYCNKTLCGPTKTTCENNCAANCANAGYKAYVPFRSAYDSLKVLPMSWSQPYLGRIHIPTSVSFYYGDPDASGQPSSSQLLQFGAGDNNREVVFMGGGIHLYDKSFDTIPTIEERFKLALFWPNLLMMDIETGYNLFEYVWPVVLNHHSTTFPVQTAGNFSPQNTIPYAMSDVLAVDVWDQVNNVIGDDGYIDRVYVGDMNGYFYGLKFNLAEHFPTPTSTNTMFGVEVNIWPTKPIAADDVPEDDYRSELQPITISPAASFEKLPTRSTVGSSFSPALRVIFGTGKYYDVSYGNDDKSDPVKMSLYNLRDPVVTRVGDTDYGLPVIDASSSDMVYDNAHVTNFRVQFAPQCGMPNSITSFRTSTPCNYEAASKDTDPNSPLQGLFQGDCCESANPTCSPTSCYKCIYDFRNPCETGDNGCLTPIDDQYKPALGKAGERVLGKPLIAQGLVYVTTFVPPYDLCGNDSRSYLYAFDYMCQPLPKDFDPFPGNPNRKLIPATSGGDQNIAGVLELGSGLASKAAMDSHGNIVIQMSDGHIEVIKTNAINKLVQFKGWRER